MELEILNGSPPLFHLRSAIGVGDHFCGTDPLSIYLCPESVRRLYLSGSINRHVGWAYTSEIRSVPGNPCRSGDPLALGT